MPQVNANTDPHVLYGMLQAATAALGEQTTRAEAAEAELRRLRGEPEPEPIDVEIFLATHGL